MEYYEFMELKIFIFLNFLEPNGIKNIAILSFHNFFFNFIFWNVILLVYANGIFKQIA